MSVFLLNGVKGEPPDTKYKLRVNTMDQLYAQLLKTRPAYSRRMCAMRCTLHGIICTVFKYKDGHCELFEEKTGLGTGITSLAGMTGIWTVDTGMVENDPIHGQM